MGKVEEVARAIWAERQKTVVEAGLHLKEWDDETPLFRGDVRREARAAIKAMREPSIAMRSVSTFQAAEIDWPAMIDAALSEDKEQG